MGLRITRLALRDFRSYESLTVELGRELTVLVGPNASGKTNIIEALQLLTAASSFRNPVWSELVRWGRETASAEFEAVAEKRVVQVRMDISGGRRSYRVNGQSKKRTADVRGMLPCVLFTPDDLRMIKDSAEKRRRAVDEVGEQLSSAYAAAGSEYDRAVRQRNALLRDPGVPAEVLAAWTERVAVLGGALAAHRIRLFERMAPVMSDIYGMLSEGESLSVVYVPSWSEGDDQSRDKDSIAQRMREGFSQREDEEKARGTSVVGPHRDDIKMFIEGRDARSFASQGQQRTAALAWKLAEVAIVEEVLGEPPVLLLDDVMSELDEKRREALARFVGDRVQTVVTTTNLGYFAPELLERAVVVEVGR